jgi:hypothetical protein
LHIPLTDSIWKISLTDNEEYKEFAARLAVAVRLSRRLLALGFGYPALRLDADPLLRNERDALRKLQTNPPQLPTDPSFPFADVRLRDYRAEMRGELQALVRAFATPLRLADWARIAIRLQVGGVHFKHKLRQILPQTLREFVSTEILKC